MPTLDTTAAPSDLSTDAELAALTAAGDGLAADLLVRRHTGLVRRVVAGFRVPPHVDTDDLVQAGLVAVWKSARGWRPEWGAKFSTYAFAAAVKEVGRELARQAACPVALDPTPDRRGESDRLRLDTLPARGPAAVPDVSAELSAMGPAAAALVRDLYGLDGRLDSRDDRGGWSGRTVWGRVAATMGITVEQAKRVVAEGLDRAFAAADGVKGDN